MKGSTDFDVEQVLGKRAIIDITGSGPQDHDRDDAGKWRMSQQEVGESFVSFGSLINSGMLSDVDIYVGPHKQRFALHKVVLSLDSGYFRRMFQPSGYRFREGREHQVELVEHKPFTCKHVVPWLYHGEMLQSSEDPKVWSICVYTDIIRTANYFHIPSLRNAAIVGAVESIREHHSFYVPDGACRKHFTRSIKDIVELYSVEGSKRDIILEELYKYGFYKDILRDKELRGLLRDEQDLMLRMLDIQAGLVKR